MSNERLESGVTATWLSTPANFMPASNRFRISGSPAAAPSGVSKVTVKTSG